MHVQARIPLMYSFCTYNILHIYLPMFPKMYTLHALTCIYPVYVCNLPGTASASRGTPLCTEGKSLAALVLYYIYYVVLHASLHGGPVARRIGTILYILCCITRLSAWRASRSPDWCETPPIHTCMHIQRAPSWCLKLFHMQIRHMWQLMCNDVKL